jgi:GMP reductase
MDKKFDFNDIALVPSVLSPISSRRDVCPFINGPWSSILPLFASPMDTVIDNRNSADFAGHIKVCLPRGFNNLANIGFVPNVFVSISLEEFETFVDNLFYNKHKSLGHKTPYQQRVLVDIANGHMKRLYDLVKEFCELRTEADDIQLMIGNIANPLTYHRYAELGVDYIRVSIGSGNACLTSANIGVHYPMASLIQECYDIKTRRKYNTKIVADGGFRNFDDIIKALALGADYVMLGSILNKTLESCAPVKLFKKLPLSSNAARSLWNKFPSMRKYFYKSYRGMSTKEVQRSWGKQNVITAEGISTTNKVEYTFSSWCQNFESYLRSAMSYCGAYTLEDFKNTKTIFITENAMKRYKK